MTAGEAVHALDRRAADWAVRRSFGPNSATGISLALAVCAAAWFTAGTRAGDAKGALALCGCYLAARAGRRLTAPHGALRSAGLVETGLVTADAGRLARVCRVLSEGVVVAGLAAGAAAAGWDGTWPVAITVLIAISVRETLRACYRVPAASGNLERHVDQVVAMPAGGRALLIVAAALAGGARAVLLGLLVWSIIAVTYAVFARAPGLRPWRAAAVAARSSGSAPAMASPDGRTALSALLTVAEPAAAVPAAAAGSAARPGAYLPPAAAGGRAAAPVMVPAVSGPALSAPGRQPGRARARVARPLLACRDDGPVALRVGRLVRGNLIPLPPAIAGTAAAAMLALLGLRDLPGSILLTPLVVMLLAAPGCSHPHDGRLDWLVPALLQTGQFIYIATLGYAAGVPAPVTFSLCVVVAAWYADVAWCAAARRPARSPAVPAQAGHQALASGPGWEGRMLAVGLGAILGIATFAYLLLTAYLVVLICWRLMTSWLAAVDGDRQ
jgi:hypothetical protein